MQLVEDRRSADPAKKRSRIRRGDQQRQLLGRGQQDVGRVELLALPLVRPACRRCASRCVIGRPISRDRLVEVALDVDGQRLQRRDVERVDAAMRLAGLALRPRRRDRSATAGSRPASCRRRSARSAAPSARPRPWPAARADAAAAPSRAPRTSRRRPPAGRRAGGRASGLSICATYGRRCGLSRSARASVLLDLRALHDDVAGRLDAHVLAVEGDTAVLLQLCACTPRP